MQGFRLLFVYCFALLWAAGVRLGSGGQELAQVHDLNVFPSGLSLTLQKRTVGGLCEVRFSQFHQN